MTTTTQDGAPVTLDEGPPTTRDIGATVVNGSKAAIGGAGWAVLGLGHVALDAVGRGVELVGRGLEFGAAPLGRAARASGHWGGVSPQLDRQVSALVRLAAVGVERVTDRVDDAAEDLRDRAEQAEAETRTTT